MEKRDYLLQEIEKIGLLLRMILSKIVSRPENSAIAIESQFEQENELFQTEMGFNVDAFLSLSAAEIEKYLSQFNGIRGANIELLADVFKEMGMKSKGNLSKPYLEKSLMLYDYCNLQDKTYSPDRESKIAEIKEIIC
jgi:hypothetical protein